MLSTELILIDSARGAASAQAHAEAGEIVVEKDLVALALRQRQSRECSVSEPHFSSQSWEDHGKIFSTPFVPWSSVFPTSDVARLSAFFKDQSDHLPPLIPVDRISRKIFQAYDEGSIPFTRSNFTCRGLASKPNADREAQIGKATRSFRASTREDLHLPAPRGMKFGPRRCGAA